MIIVAFITLFVVAIGSLAYFWTRFRKFSFIRKIAEKSPKRAGFVALIPVLLLVVLFIFETVIATILCLHLLVFWLLSDLINWIIAKVSGKTFLRYYAGVAAIVVTGIYLSVGWYYGHHVYRTDYAVQTDKELGTDRLRIVQISDVHLGSTFDAEKFAEYMRRVGELSPDLVVVTGDYVDDDSRKAEMIRATEALGRIKSTYGIYYVHGNHDKGYFNSRDFTIGDLLEEFKKNNIQVLEDEAVSLTDQIVLIGRKDRSDQNRLDTADLMRNIDREKYVIMLDHQPHDFDEQERAEVDLVLCGHTHGGQMFPVGITGEFTGANDKTYGMEKRKNTTFIVNSGISDWAIPFKTAAIAEYGVIDVER